MLPTNPAPLRVRRAGMTAATSPRGMLEDPTWPANLAGGANFRCVIAVAAVDADDRLAQFSSYGPNVRIAAYGVNVRVDTVLPLTDPWANRNQDGCSFATPAVAGAALLLVNAFPMATNLQIRDCLISTATRTVNPPIGFPNRAIGGGILDVNAAYDCLARQFGVVCLQDTLQIQLPQAGNCGGALVRPTDLYALAAPGLTPIIDPVSPALPSVLAPGSYTFTINPNNGAASCQARVVIRECPQVSCVNVQRSLLQTGPNTCDDAAVPITALFVGGPTGVIATASPPSPYVPGTVGSHSAVTS